MMPKYLPVLYAYSTDGTERWRTILRDFHLIGIVETVYQDRPAVRLNAEQPSDITTSLVAFEDLVIVQLAHRDSSSLLAKRPHAFVHTYLLDAASGKGVFVTDSLPRIVDFRASSAYAVQEEPYPRIEVWQTVEQPGPLE